MALDEKVNELKDRINRHETMDAPELAQLALDLGSMAGFFARLQERVLVRLADKIGERR